MTQDSNELLRLLDQLIDHPSEGPLPVRPVVISEESRCSSTPTLAAGPVTPSCVKRSSVPANGST